MLSSVPLGFFSPAVIFSSFLFVGIAALTTTQPGFFCLSVQKPFWIRHQMGPSCYNQQYLFSFIINYNWVEWNVCSDFSPLRIPQNPDVKFFFFKSLHCCPQSTSLSYMSSIWWTKKRKKITVKFIFSIPFSWKKTPILENLLLSSWKQLTAWCLPTVHHGYIWFSVSKWGCNGWCASLRQDWLFKAIFEPTESCLKLEIAKESQ